MSNNTNYAVFDKKDIFEHLDVFLLPINKYGLSREFRSQYVDSITCSRLNRSYVIRFYCLAKLSGLSEKRARKIHDKIIEYLEDNKHKKITIYTRFIKTENYLDSKITTACYIQLFIKRNYSGHKHKFIAAGEVGWEWE